MVNDDNITIKSPYRKHAKEATIETYHDSNVVALKLPNGAVAQLSRLLGRVDEPDGYLVRVWPANGTAENDGSNLEVLSAVVYCPDDGMKTTVESLRISTPSDFWFNISERNK